MASTTFIDNQTVIYAAWLNDVNNVVYNGIFQSPSISATNMICTGSASGAGFTALVSNTFASPAAIGNVTPNTGAFTTLTSTGYQIFGNAGNNLRGFNVNSAEISYQNSAGTGVIFNFSNTSGSNGNNYSILFRGLISGASAGANLTAVDFNTDSFLINGSKIGVGVKNTSWHDVTGSRAFGVTYTNSYSYPIMIAVSASQSGSNGNHTLNVYVSGVTIATQTIYAAGNSGPSITGIVVPPGQTYYADNTGSNATTNLSIWTELY